MRRLLTLSGTARAAISAVAPRIPGPFVHPSGMPPSRAETDAFRRPWCWRASSTMPFVSGTTRPSRERSARSRSCSPPARRASPRRSGSMRMPSRARRRSSPTPCRLSAARREAPRGEERPRRDPRSTRATLSGGPPRGRASRSPRAPPALPSSRAGASRTGHRRCPGSGRGEARDHRAALGRLPR